MADPADANPHVQFSDVWAKYEVEHREPIEISEKERAEDLARWHASDREAFIPRYGNRSRALRILNEAAGWHDARVVRLTRRRRFVRWLRRGRRR